MAASSVFDFTTQTGIIHSLNVKKLAAVSLSGPGGQGEGQLQLSGDAFNVSSGDYPAYADAVTAFALWRQRMDDFA